LIETEEDGQRVMALLGKLQIYAPHFKGPVTTEDSVKSVLGLMEKASIEGGYAGAFLSHSGGKQWL
jgi:hypothetical protein